MEWIICMCYCIALFCVCYCDLRAAKLTYKCAATEYHLTWYFRCCWIQTLNYNKWANLLYLRANNANSSQSTINYMFIKRENLAFVVNNYSLDSIHRKYRMLCFFGSFLKIYTSFWAELSQTLLVFCS